MLPKLGIEVRFAEDDSPAAFARLVDSRTKAIFFETIGNPAGNVADLEGIVQVAREHGIATIADNTVPSPALLTPIAYGVDVVVHARPKYLGGQVGRASVREEGGGEVIISVVVVSSKN